MKTLGHADAATAMRYQHPGLEQLRKAVEEGNREHAEMLARGTQPAVLTRTKQRVWNLHREQIEL